MIIGGLEFHKHEIDGSDGGRQEKDFHRRVVQGNEAGEQVQVLAYFLLFLAGGPWSGSTPR